MPSYTERLVCMKSQRTLAATLSFQTSFLLAALCLSVYITGALANTFPGPE